MTEPMNVVKYGYTAAISDEQLLLSRELATHAMRWMNSTPTERATWAREAKELRELQRADAEQVPLSLDVLLTRMGWSREYTEHLVQPYCECGDDIDGWTRCQHAQDLGLTA